MNIWVIFSLGLLYICYYDHVRYVFYVHVYTFLLDIFLGVKWSDNEQFKFNLNICFQIVFLIILQIILMLVMVSKKEITFLES